MDMFDLDNQAPDEVATPEVFRVVNEEHAAWVVNRILTVEEKIARLEAQYKKASAALAREKEALEARFMAPLEAWAEANLPRKGRTIHLLTGSLSFRAVKGGPRVADSAATLAWASEALPDAVITQTTRKVDAAAVKAYVMDTGEIPPGVEIIEDAQRFYVRGGGAND
jgi:phage host-nuclease inhibitor protein Gam